MVQLVASGRGVCALPNWALAPYVANDHVATLKLGAGLFSTLYIAVREEQKDSPYMAQFLKIAQETCFQTLTGISRV
jgi:LysR family transcriptional regulator for metE and metH